MICPWRSVAASWRRHTSLPRRDRITGVRPRPPSQQWSEPHRRRSGGPPTSGDLRAAAGDPASARRYYAEAIDEARDIGAEHEQGLAALGLGRSLMELGEVTAARRLGAAARDLLGRAGAPTPELEEAERLLGTEMAVGERTKQEET